MISIFTYLVYYIKDNKTIKTALPLMLTVDIISVLAVSYTVYNDLISIKNISNNYRTVYDFREHLQSIIEQEN